MQVVILLGLLLGFHVNEPKIELPRDKNGKISFQEEVVVKDLGKDALFVNAVNFFGRVKKASERKPVKPSLEKDAIMKEGSFYVYTKGLFTPQIHGEITYTLSVELKENAYKYTYNNFVFQFYEKNRYGQFAPVNGKVKALEDEKFAGMQKTWLSHKEVTMEAIEKHIIELKKKMKEVPPGARSRGDNHFEDAY